MRRKKSLRLSARCLRFRANCLTGALRSQFPPVISPMSCADSSHLLREVGRRPVLRSQALRRRAVVAEIACSSQAFRVAESTLSSAQRPRLMRSAL